MLLFVLFWSFLTAQALELPRQLSADDRKEVVRTLGLNSSMKLLSNPYPLGGYSGFEMGYSVEFINVRDIRRLGCEPGTAGCANTNTSDQTEWRYSRFTVGKGLYKDVDIFFSFMPPAGGVNASDYGAAVRWSFYQAPFLPINVSAVAHFNQLNFTDSFINRNYGAEIICGVNVDNFALYFGGGVLEGRGTFLGGCNSGTCNEDSTVDETDPDINKASNTATTAVTETHTVVGLSLHYENLFAAAQVDRYRDAVYSMKVGLRF